MKVFAPRIYSLHPLLAGPIEGWGEHLPRVAGMGFDWLHASTFWAPGASGGIDAVRDPSELHPIVRGDSALPADRLVEAFAREARGRGLSLMLDLIVPHAARDSLLVEERPDWFRLDEDGGLAAPSLANPGDRHRRAGAMDDLAELDLADPALRAAQVEHFAGQARRLLDLGASGFRCTFAYKVPPDFWRDLTATVRETHPEAVFLAAALGCPFPLVRALAGCGFDLILDSSRWWDFHGAWFLDQHDDLRRVAATVAFPEDHDSPRLAESYDVEGPEETAQLYRARYLASLAVGSGVMMPMGFEYGCRRRVDPARTRPEDWQTETASPVIDLTGFVALANAVKRDTRVLGVPGPLRRVSAPNARIVGLLRLDAGSALKAGSAALVLVNPDLARTDGIAPGPLLTAAGGRVAGFADVTPDIPPLSFAIDEPLLLDPLGVRLFVAEAGDAHGQAASATDSEATLQALAAHRVAVERVTPELDGGRFPAKRVVGDLVTVEADIFVDGHDKLGACVRYRARDEADWREAPMAFVDNDRWGGAFPVTRNTRYVYTVEAWRDLFASWLAEIVKKHDAGLNVALELTEGRQLVERTAGKATGEDAGRFRDLLAGIEERADDPEALLDLMLGEDVRELMARCDLRVDRSGYGRELELWVDRTAAAFAAWYEIFPRSMSDDPERHGTFDDVIAKLPYVRGMGFDVLYFPPIHPIGRKNRKGRNNSLTAGPGDPGSPYAIGSAEGGHRAIHPEFGTEDDFRRLVAAAHDHGLEIALDFAIQAAPDHPWITEHPEWFDWRPDGTLKYAENPPKKYEDISHIEFYGGALPLVWYELRDTFLHWIDLGVKTFRVDNPHTKPYPFWEWCIREIQDRHPDAIFLAEAFTRPKVMKRLAKLGYTQSYSYFTWRNTKAELTAYLTELTQEEPKEHMRPNFFVNTPDINPVWLQTAGRPGFRIRAVLAATLSPLWGVYSGFELCEATPVPGREEYLDSEKYEIKAWDWDRPGNIRGDVALLNRVRRENPAMWDFTNLWFHPAYNDQIMVYSKISAARDNAIVVAVNLDPQRAQACYFEIPLWRLGLPDDASVAVEDLGTGQRFAWTGKSQHVWLDPHSNPYAIWRIVPPGLPS